MRAKAGTTIQTVHVLLILLGFFMNYTSVIEFLRQKDLKPARNMWRRKQLHIYEHKSIISNTYSEQKREKFEGGERRDSP